MVVDGDLGELNSKCIRRLLCSSLQVVVDGGSLYNFFSKNYRLSFHLDKFLLDFFSVSLLNIGIILLSLIVIHCHRHFSPVSLFSISTC